MEKRNPLDVAKWLLENNLIDEPKDSLKGNMKLQKLLFFSQLINYALYNKPLFDAQFSAFEHGVVIEEVRNTYKTSLESIQKRETINFTGEELNTLKLTKEIYGDASADELSDLTHQFECWKKYYKQSKTTTGYKIKNKAIIPESELKSEIDIINNVLRAYSIINNINRGKVDLDY